MANSRQRWVAAALCLAIYVASGAAADPQQQQQQQQGCSDLTYSKFLGTKTTGAKYIDHSKLMDKGAITQVSLYYNKVSGCLRGAKAVHGDKPTPAMVGTSANTTETAIKLKDGEFVTKVDYKAAKCIGFLKLHTNKGRSISVGSASAPAAMITSAANKNGGRLVALRGFQSMRDSKPGALQQLQFVWGTANCHPAAAAAELNYESGSLPNSDPTVCTPKLDMCNEKASMNQFSYCVWNPPFIKSACRGGCCLSSGKCASSSCAISGVGRDVANMICYGTNSGVGFGGSELCSGLACKLATTGCTTDAFGGNCVGTVVHYAKHVEVHPSSQKYIGATCLDATPSDYTLNDRGEPAGTEGNYMSKLWTICDCSTDGSDPYAGVPNVINLTGMTNVTKNDVLLAISQVLPKVNFSDALHGPKEHTPAELFPSITDIFKKPSGAQTIGITLPSFFGNDHTASSDLGNSSDAPTIQFQLPDLSTLLSTLASKANSSSSPVGTAALEPSLTPPITPGSVAAIPAKVAASAAKPAAAALTGLKGLLGKLMPQLQASIMRKAGPANATNTAAAPVDVAAVPAEPPAANSSVVPPMTSAAAPVAVQASPAPAAAPAAAPKVQQAAPTAQVAAAAAPVSTSALAPAADPAPSQTATQQQQQQQQQQAGPTSTVPTQQAPVTAPQPAAAAAAPQAAPAAETTPSVITVPARPSVITVKPPSQQQDAQVTAADQSQKPARPWYGGFSGLPSALATFRPWDLPQEALGEQPAAVQTAVSDLAAEQPTAAAAAGSAAPQPAADAVAVPPSAAQPAAEAAAAQPSAAQSAAATEPVPVQPAAAAATPAAAEASAASVPPKQQ